MAPEGGGPTTNGRIDLAWRSRRSPGAGAAILVLAVVLGLGVSGLVGVAVGGPSHPLRAPREGSPTSFVSGGARALSVAPRATGLTSWEVGATVFPEGNATAARGNFPYLTTTPSLFTYDGAQEAYWVGNTGPGPLLEVAAANLSLLRAVPSVLNTSGVAYDPQNGILYTYSLNNGTISAVNATTGALVGAALTVSNGGGYGGIPLLVVPSASELFVPTISPHRLVVVSTSNDSVVKTLPLGPGVPSDLTYDPTTGEVYAISSIGSQIYAVNASTLNVTTNLPAAGGGPTNITYDAATGDLLVANGISNNISVIDPSKGLVVGPGFPLPFSPIAFAVDPADHLIYVSNGLNQVYAVNDTTGALVGSPTTVGSGADSLAYDTQTGSVLTLNFNDNNISAINGTDSLLTGNSPYLGAKPIASADDPMTHTLFVADEAGASGLLERIDTRTLSSAGPPIPLASAAIGAVAVDPAANVVLVAYDPSTGGSGEVEEFNATTGSPVGLPVSVGVEPDSMQYDPVNGNAYIANHGSDTVTALNVVSDKAIGLPFTVGVAPTSILLFPFLGLMWVVNSASSNISIYNISSNKLIATLSTSSFPTYAAYDPADGTVYVTLNVQTSGPGTQYTRSLELFNASNYNLISTVPYSASWDLAGIVYDPSSQDLFILSDNQCGCGSAPDTYNGTVSVIDGSSILTSEGPKFNIPVGERPYSFTLVPNPSGASEVWVNNYLTGTLSVIALPPTLKLFRVTPSVTEVGVPVTLETIYGGGGSPVIAYIGLPAGCVSASTPFLQCIPSIAGTYHILSTLTDPVTGTFLSAASTLTVEPRVQVSVAVPTRPIDVGDSVTFTATPTGGVGPYTIDWMFGDGQLANGTSVTHSYSSPGSFAVTAQVTDGLFGTATTALSVVVSPGPSVGIFSPEAATDVGFPVLLTAELSGGSSPVTYDWSLGDGANASGPAVNTSYAAPSAYTVTLSAEDAAGHIVYATKVIRISSLPVVTASAAVASVAVGAPVEFSANGTGGTGALQYAWEFGDGSGTAGSAPAHAYARAGTYTAVVWANDTVGGSARHSVTVTVTASTNGTPPNTTPHPSGSSSSGFAGYWVIVAALLGLVVGGLVAALAVRRRPPPPLKPAAPLPPPPAAWMETPGHAAPPAPGSGADSGSGKRS